MRHRYTIHLWPVASLRDARGVSWRSPALHYTALCLCGTHHTALCLCGTHHTALRLCGVNCTVCVSPLRGCKPWVGGFGQMGQHPDSVVGSAFVGVMWGKYRKGWFKVTLPISFQFHHAQMDGGHAAKFLDDLQNTMIKI